MAVPSQTNIPALGPPGADAGAPPGPLPPPRFGGEPLRHPLRHHRLPDPSPCSVRAPPSLWRSASHGGPQPRNRWQGRTLRCRQRKNTTPKGVMRSFGTAAWPSRWAIGVRWVSARASWHGRLFGGVGNRNGVYDTHRDFLRPRRITRTPWEGELFLPTRPQLVKRKILMRGGLSAGLRTSIQERSYELRRRVVSREFRIAVHGPGASATRHHSSWLPRYLRAFAPTGRTG